MGLLALEAFYRPIAYKGLYFQAWSSEAMMQTVSILDLRANPFQTLWNIHIQPPVFDFIRAILANIVGSNDPSAMLFRVDYCLYMLWAVVYCLTVFLVFFWLSEMTTIAFAAGAALLFSAHPALILYAAFLETTLLSAFLILCFCYLLWRIMEGRSVPPILLAITFLSLYFTRSVFQWHWVFLLPVCLILLRYPRRKTIIFFVIVASVTGLYTVKQKTLFGLSSTSSFTGWNLYNSIGFPDVWKFYSDTDTLLQCQAKDHTSPQVLTRTHKLNGARNFNNRHFLAVNRKLQEEYRQQLIATPLPKLVHGVLHNLRIYFKPSSRYTNHIIVDNIPWRAPYDFILSFPVLPLLLGAAAIFWLKRMGNSARRGAIGLCLPVICIMGICILFERGENMRFKFFIEPVLYCFIATTSFMVWGHLKNILTRTFDRAA